MAQTATGENPAPAPAEGESRVIDFKADKLDYDSEAETVVASGNVRMMSEGNRVRADQVSWDRTTGRVIATGNVAATTADGDTAYGDRVELTDTLRDDVVDNIILVLERGGRIPARSGRRTELGRATVQ